VSSNTEWKEVTLTLCYRDSALTPGGESPDEPEILEELVEEINHLANSHTLGGQVRLSLGMSQERAVAKAVEVFRAINATAPDVFPDVWDLFEEEDSDALDAQVAEIIGR